MRYCPNCSAYQYEEGAKICGKCGFDMEAHEAQMREKRSKEEVQQKQESLIGFTNDVQCPVCGEPMKTIDTALELPFEGQRINVHGLKLMGGDITKKTVTMYQVDLLGMQCSSGHRFFSAISARTRALCPLCYDAMIEYGSSLFSCTRCQRHFSKADWSFPEPEEVLTNEGWFPLE